MKLDLSPEEVAIIMSRRQEEYNHNRPDRVYSKDCEHLNYDADGDYCNISKGLGVNSHCWAKRDKECPFYKATRGGSKC